MRRFALLLSVFVLLCGVRRGEASISFTFSGTVSRPGSAVPAVEDPAGLLDGSVFEGTTFSGTFSFDPTVPPSIAAPPFDTSFATYRDIGRVAATVENYSLTGVIEIIIENDFASLMLDGYSPRTSGNSGFFTNGVDTYERVGWVTTLEDLDGSIFSSLDLPLSPPDLTEFESNQFLIRLEQPLTGEVAHIWGSMNTLAVSRIPEPTSLAVGPLIGFVGLRVGWRRRSRGQGSKLSSRPQQLTSQTTT